MIIRPVKETAQQVVRGGFRTGLAICLSTGAFGTAFIYGSKSSGGLVENALQAGASSQTFAEFAALLVTFNAGMFPGIVYSVYKLNRNRTWAAFRNSRVLFRNFSLAVAMAVLWYSGILIYNSSAVKLGPALGPSISFALYAGLPISIRRMGAITGLTVGPWS